MKAIIDRLDFLSQREKDVLKLRLDGVSLQGIGDRMGVCRERIRQIEDRAKKRIISHIGKTSEIFYSNKKIELENLNLKQEIALLTNDVTSIKAKFEKYVLDKKSQNKVSIDILELSNRSHNALLRANLLTLGDLQDYIRDNDLSNLKQIGFNSKMEILSKLESHNCKDCPLRLTEHLISAYIA